MDAETHPDPDVHNTEVEEDSREESTTSHVPDNLEHENSRVEQSFTNQSVGQEHSEAVGHREENVDAVPTNEVQFEHSSGTKEDDVEYAGHKEELEDSSPQVYDSESIQHISVYDQEDPESGFNPQQWQGDSLEETSEELTAAENPSYQQGHDEIVDYEAGPSEQAHDVETHENPLDSNYDDPWTIRYPTEPPQENHQPIEDQEIEEAGDPFDTNNEDPWTIRYPEMSGQNETLPEDDFESMLRQPPSIEEQISDDRQGPEAQGYSLLPDDDSPPKEEFVDEESGATSADVENAIPFDTNHNGEDFFASQLEEQEAGTEKVNAFSQIQGSISHTDVALEFVANQLVNPSDHMPSDMPEERSSDKQGWNSKPNIEDIWSENEDARKFEFGNIGDQRVEDGPFEPFPTMSDEPKEVEKDPFGEISGTNGANRDDLMDMEGGEGELLDDVDIAKLFPVPAEEGPQAPLQSAFSSDQPQTSSLFGDTTDSTNPFNSQGNLSIAPTSDPLVDLGLSQPTESQQQETTTSNPADDAQANNGLLDDLDFIDDSEFMAAFGTSTSPQAPSSQPIPAAPVTILAPTNGSAQSLASRYAPRQPTIPVSRPLKPAQPSLQPSIQPYQPYVPPTVAPSQPTQPIQAAQPATRAVSSRYTPSPAPQPIPTQPTQYQPAQGTWNQQPVSAPLAPPPKSQSTQPIAGKSVSSFVTAKSAYHSPYDLPASIAALPARRHVSPPMAPQKSPPMPTTAPPPLCARPPSRSTSAQPHFQTQQSVPPPGARSASQFAAPPNVASPPPVVNTFQTSSQYDLRRSSLSPPSQQVYPDQHTQPQNIYDQRRVVSPPTITPQQPPSPSQTRYAPPVSPPLRYGQATGPNYAPGRVISPPAQQSPMVSQFQPSSHAPPQITSPPPQVAPPVRYGPGEGRVAQRNITSQPVGPTQQQQQTTWQGQGQRAEVRSPPYGQSPLPAPPTQQHHPQMQPTYSQYPGQQLGTSQPNIRARSPYQPPHGPPAQPALNPPFQAPQAPQVQGAPQVPQALQEVRYEQQQFISVQVEGNPHSDLPPHFEMMAAELGEEVYDPESFQIESSEYPDRHVMKTPELVQHKYEEEISPPRPWERAMNEQLRGQSPTKTRSFSQYDPRSPVSPYPPQVLERQRTASPPVTRPLQYSPKKDNATVHSLPSRGKPASHLRYPAAAAATAPRTHEEDFEYRRGGFPIVNFGFGGRMITMIPRSPHRVRGAVNLSVPGSIVFSNLKDIVEPPLSANSFPGPLFQATKPVKAKAKEIAKWLDDNLVKLDQVREISVLDEESISRIEDGKILFKLLKLLVENNGVLDGNPELEKIVRELLLPQTLSLQTEGSQSFGVTASQLAAPTALQSNVADPNALATYNLTTDFLRSVRTLLLQGDRQGAMRKALDNKMWGHALLIASSIGPTAWRDVVEQFVRTELRETGSKDIDSLRFLYGVWGGEGLDCVNELLPPINRMVSSVNASTVPQAPRFASWKESVGLVLLNKGSMDCSPALIGLGSALVKEGRVEAGHVCFLLTKFAAKFTAPDIPETHYSLIGSDINHAKESYVGLVPILLSETFEYSQSKFAPEGFPHLLPYKLWHAWALADYGHTDLAERYCESIGATLEKEKRGSIFIKPILINVLRELTERLSEVSASQGTSAEKSSWFGKKSTLGDTFWKSVESNLTKFVAGDEATEDPGSVSMARKQSQAEDPRFGRIASDTNLNRMASLPNLRYQATTPVYGSFPQDFRSPGSHSRYPTNSSESRYTPGARHEQAPVQAVQEYDGGTPIHRPDSGFETPEPVNAGYVQPVQSGYSPYVPMQSAPAPMAPPAPQFEITEPYAEDEPIHPKKEAEPEPEVKEEESGKEGGHKERKLNEKPSGWFGGWFKRGGSEPAEATGTPGKPIKAKLGEEMALVFDKDLKKWVNKKTGEAVAKTTAAPPPPKRGPALKPITPTAPSASLSKSAPPTALLPTPTPSVPALPQTPTTSAAPPAPAATPKDSLPPSRPTSTLPPPSGKVDPLEELLATRPASGARGPKKPARSRYVDVMNKK